jgi:chlorite dismutase
MDQFEEPQATTWNFRERLAFLSGFTTGAPFMLVWMAVSADDSIALYHRFLFVGISLLMWFASWQSMRTSQSLYEMNHAASALRLINASLKKPLPKTASIPELRDAVILELTGLCEPDEDASDE